MNTQGRTTLVVGRPLTAGPTVTQEVSHRWWLDGLLVWLAFFGQLTPTRFLTQFCGEGRSFSDC